MATTTKKASSKKVPAKKKAAPVTDEAEVSSETDSAPVTKKKVVKKKAASKKKVVKKAPAKKAPAKKKAASKKKSSGDDMPITEMTPAEIEAVSQGIEEPMRSFQNGWQDWALAVGEPLKRLAHAMGKTRFNEYCEERWNMAPRDIYRAIQFTNTIRGPNLEAVKGCTQGQLYEIFTMGDTEDITKLIARLQKKKPVCEWKVREIRGIADKMKASKKRSKTSDSDRVSDLELSATPLADLINYLAKIAYPGVQKAVDNLLDSMDDDEIRAEIKSGTITTTELKVVKEFYTNQRDNAERIKNCLVVIKTEMESEEE